jgi:S1-C subfamily serine protease
MSEIRLALLVCILPVFLTFCLHEPRQLAATEKQEDISPRQIVGKIDPAVVTIHVADGRQGSGFMVDTKGTVVTNYHLVAGATSAKVVLRDQTTVNVAGYVAYSPGKDLVILWPLRLQPNGQARATEYSHLAHPLG